jgi:UDP-glucose 4-epimerase
MNILVTGGAGFIGYHLCKKLSENHNVTVIDRKIGIEIGSLAMFKILENEKFDAIFHLAANSDIKQSRPEVEHEDTFMTTRTMLDICRSYDIKRFMFASSSAIFGSVDEIIDEDCSHKPISFYGAAKSASESLIRAHVYNFGMQAWIYRFPNVVGSHSTHGVILDLLKKHKQNPDKLEVLGTGEQCKPYIHVSELVDAMLHIYVNLKEWVNVVNISSTGHTSVKEIAEMITDGEIEYTGGKAWRDDVEHYSFDTSKLRRSNWISKINSTEAVKLAIEEIRKEI